MNFIFVSLRFKDEKNSSNKYVLFATSKAFSFVINSGYSSLRVSIQLGSIPTIGIPFSA